ncbi:MAG: HD domain-containing protein [Cyanobacteria bacterium SIG27]|nr:HD domain-containing protein [Cyanobacteria bacterium SIG27]MBQ9150409.1 HD domain-containing protein [bacterium]
MGLLERLGGVLNNKNATAKKAATPAPFFGNDFNSKALNKYNLNKDTISFGQDRKFATDVITTNDELALNQPIRFIKKYVNEATIKNAIEKNPNIERILKENGLTADFNLQNVESIVMSHLIPTSKTAQKIYTKMGHAVDEASYVYLTQAALLHDIGKCFIPSEILNKRGKLTLKERAIIQLHNKLSYEILKTTDLNPQVAQLAFEHHDYEKSLKRSQENQALTISDVYCALKENRPYKKPLSDLCARTILYDMGTKGSFDTRYINLVCA